MRQLSASLRLAVSALAVAATAGCMSVGEDGAKPGPSSSADRKAAAEATGGSVSGRGSGVHGNGRGSKPGAAGEEGKPAEDGKASGATGASPSPGAPAGRPEPRRRRRVREAAPAARVRSSRPRADPEAVALVGRRSRPLSSRRARCRP